MVFPFYSTSVAAGFPSPADDYIEQFLSLDEHLAPNPPATFLVKVDGDSMTSAGISNGDILIVDRSINPKHDHIVIAAINGDLTVKQLSIDNNLVKLLPRNSRYKQIQLLPEQDFKIWGVVTAVIHQFYKT